MPQDPSPAQGQVQIHSGANFLQILQQTPQAIINWGQFNIQSGETVRFLQPGPQATILNRVTGLDPSVIEGALQANGRVFLLNPNGILFGPNAMVDVGSFTASTLKMSDQDFLNGTYRLTQASDLPLAALTNQGTIRVAEGGFVVLVSPLLDNQGLIVAQAGQVNLAAGTRATFSVDGRGLVQFSLPDGFAPQFHNAGQGGTVLLQPGQMSQLLGQVIQNPALVEAGSFEPAGQTGVLAHGAEGVLLNSGTIRADGGSVRLDSSQVSLLAASGTLQAEGGDVRLLSAGKTVSLGSILASGGQAEVSGRELWLWGPVQSAGLLLDPSDITIIDGAGGSFDGQLPNPNGSGAGTVSVTAMQGQSAVQLSASHDVTYNGNGFSLPSTSLTIMAGNDILLTSTGSIQATAFDLQAGRNLAVSGPGLASTSGSLALAAANVSLQSAGNFNLSSPTQIAISATGGDLLVVTPNLATLNLSAPSTRLAASNNLTVSTSDVVQNSPGAVRLDAGNVTLGNDSGRFNLVVGSLAVNATNDFAGKSSNVNDLNLRTTTGALNITAGQALGINASNFVFLTSDQGEIDLSGASLDLRGAPGVIVNAHQDVNLEARNGDLFLQGGPNGSSLPGIRVQSSNGAVNVSAGQDLTLSSGADLDLHSALGTTLHATRDLRNTVPTGSSILYSAPTTKLEAGRNLTLSGSSVSQNSSGSLNMSGRNVTFENNNGGFGLHVGSLNVTAAENFAGRTSNTGNFDLRTSSGPLELSAGQAVAVNASNFVFLTSDQDRISVSGSSVDLRGPAGVIVTARQDVEVRAESGDLLVRGGPNASSLPGVRFQTSDGAVNLSASGGVNLNSGSDFDFRSALGATVNATGNFSATTPSGSALLADGGGLNVTAGNLSLSGSNLVVNNNGNLSLQAVGNLSVAGLTIGTGANASLQGANISLASMDQVSGGNYTLSTPGNLTELNASNNPSDLTGLNISAGRAFNLSTSNHRFSIPNTTTGNPLALVTAGNDSQLGSAASFQTFHSAVLNPDHIDMQTGDILVNGVLVYGGTVPPPPPPQPTPTPGPTAVTAEVATALQDTVTPEQRAQILVQSNLALGNLDGFSTMLSSEERDHLSLRMDSLVQSWPRYPFAATMSVSLPGGPPSVYSGQRDELAWLDSAAYNAFLDQELREIWEVRYWRRLLERILVWEDD